MSRLHGADRRALVVGYRALSELLRVAGAEDAAGVLIRVVTELGGTTVPARLATDDALPLDLSCGHGEPLQPVAPAGTRARTRLATVLPALLEDARVAVARAERVNRLAEQVDVDPLTGLLNRRAFQRLLPRLRAGDSVLLIDLDRFKELNDTYGHAAGDEVLTTFSRVLREQGRAEDHYSRLGGDEFLGIFPATTVADVAQGVDRLRAVWARVAPFPVTFSAGIAAVGAAGGAAAVVDADATMYAAKDTGQGRTSTHAVAATVGRAPDVTRPHRLTREVRRARHALPILLRHMSAFDVSAATDLADRLLDDGMTVTQVTQLLASAQDELGRRWQSGASSIADEHGATAVADAILAAVAGYSDPADARGEPLHVVLACPEGEWHQLPGRMAAALLADADAGLVLTALGPSLPARDLQQALTRQRSDALILSCTMASNLLSAKASIRAAHEVGVPVLVGGRAFGHDGRRAEAVGADGWANDIDTAVRLLRGWQEHPPALQLPRQKLGETVPLVVTEQMEQAILDRLPAELRSDAEVTAAQLDSAAADVRGVLDHLHVALSVGDDRIFTEFIEWRSHVQAPPRLPADVLAAGYRAIDEVLGDVSPHARRLLRDASAGVAALR